MCSNQNIIRNNTIFHHFLHRLVWTWLRQQRNVHKINKQEKYDWKWLENKRKWNNEMKNWIVILTIEEHQWWTSEIWWNITWPCDCRPRDKDDHVILVIMTKMITWLCDCCHQADRYQEVDLAPPCRDSASRSSTFKRICKK